VACTRIDVVLICAPVLAALALTAKRDGARARELAIAAGVGAAPILAWEAFSLLYYGALVPNTALAKLGTGLPANEGRSSRRRRRSVRAARLASTRSSPAR
jgi:arabinofuranosyltransferase